MMGWLKPECRDCQYGRREHVIGVGTDYVCCKYNGGYMQFMDRCPLDEQESKPDGE